MLVDIRQMKHRFQQDCVCMYISYMEDLLFPKSVLLKYFPPTLLLSDT